MRFSVSIFMASYLRLLLLQVLQFAAAQTHQNKASTTWNSIISLAKMSKIATKVAYTCIAPGALALDATPKMWFWFHLYANISVLLHILTY